MPATKSGPKINTRKVVYRKLFQMLCLINIIQLGWNKLKIVFTNNYPIHFEIFPVPPNVRSDCIGKQGYCPRL